MNIQILSHTPDAVNVAFTAIRTCYSPYNYEKLWYEEFYTYKEKDNDHLRLIKQIVNHGHTSTLEHISFTFGISGVSRVLLAQLTRHRVGFSYSVQSQRYVNAQKHPFEYVTPKSLYDMDDYVRFMETAQELYDRLISKGVKPEDARMVLPGAATTNLVMTVNLRALLDFYGKRNYKTHAQSEIADFAETLKELVIQAEPWMEQLFEEE